MFDITLLAMGKLKEPFYLSAAAEYAKRLSGYCKFTLLELPEVRLPENPSPAEIAAGLEKEADVIFSKIPKGAWFCVFTPEGKTLSSEDFAKQLKSVKNSGKSSACFLIGSSLHGPPGKAAGGFPAVHGPHDLPTPSRPDHGAGTALPGRGHPGRVQISQISQGADAELCVSP